MDANVLSDFDLTPKANISELLWDCTLKYEELVKSANATREGMAEAESRVRNNWAGNPELVKVAETMIDAVWSIMSKEIDANPELSAALFVGINKKLSERVKSDRDYYIGKVVKESRKVPEVPANLEGLKKLIAGLFMSCDMMGFLPADYPVEYDKDGKNKRPKLSRKPYETRKSPSQVAAISKRFVWTIDGVVVEDSPAGIRNRIDVDKVADIWDYFGIESRGKVMNGTKYEANIKGKTVTMQVIGADESIDDDDDINLDDLDEDTDTDSE